MENMISFNVALLNAIAAFLQTTPVFYMVGTFIGLVVIDFVLGVFFEIFKSKGGK